jgi:hypothetical protein
MDVRRILSEIDAEIARLQQARSALTGIAGSGTVATRRGRPKGSVNKTKTKRKRNLSPEGRKRIADAMKRRWAERRAATSGKSGGKKESK